MRTQPSPGVFREISNGIGCDIATIKAVFEIEAGGVFFKSDGSILRRFEPHHFPRTHWPALGFKPGSKATWRASLALSKSRRAKMFIAAENIDAEAAYQAASWGAPQIMGFNHEPAGFPSAIAMVDSFNDDADNQVRAFFNFVVSEGLDSALRSQDWHAFASGYNGSGKAADYAAKLQSAYRRHSGGQASPTVQRMGSRGSSVQALQTALLRLGYFEGVDAADGTFGASTKKAVMTFQLDNGMVSDGVVGAQTWAKIKELTGDVMVKTERQPDRMDVNLKDVVAKGGPLLTGGAASGILATLGENTQMVLVGGVMLIAVIIAAAWAVSRFRR